MKKKSSFLAWLLSISLCLSLCPVSSVAISNDIAAPVPTGISMEAPGATVAPGDILYFNVNVTDESDIDRVYLCFDLTGENAAEISLESDRMVLYDKETGVAQVKLEVKGDMLSGKYVLDYIYVVDYYGNTEYYHDGQIEASFDEICFTITGTSTDITAPIPTGVSMENPGATVTSGDTLYFNVNVTDESDIDRVYLCFDLTGENAAEISLESDRMVSYDKETGVAQVKLEVMEDMLSGKYVLDYIYVVDYYGNTEYYRDGQVETSFDEICFTITGTSTDITAPIPTGVSMDSPGAIFTLDNALFFYVNVTDESGIDEVVLKFDLTGENAAAAISLETDGIVVYDKGTGVALVGFEVQDNMISGKYILDYIYISDNCGNREYYSNAIPGFDDIEFTLVSPDTFPTSISIPKELTVAVCDVRTIRPVFEPATVISGMKWTSSDTNIVEICDAGSPNSGSANVTGISPGVATVTGVTSNGLSASCEVTVVDAPPPTAGSIDSVYYIDVGEKIHVHPSLTPTNATSLYEITSDNYHVADVGTAGGLTSATITGINPGKATITIRGRNDLVMTTTAIVGDSSAVQHEKITVDAIPATCKEKGQTAYDKCSACDYLFTRSKQTPKSDHSWIEATCLVPKTCSVCGVTEGDTSAHSFGEWKELLDGRMQRVCAVCGETENKYLPLVGCIGEKISVVLETNIDSAYALENENVSMEFVNLDVIKEGSNKIYKFHYEFEFFEPGNISLTLVQKRTGDVVFLTAEISDHSWELESSKPAGCAIWGSDLYCCSKCNTKDIRPITPLGHTWQDPACLISKTCIVCNATDGDPLGHVYDNEEDADCNTCGMIREKHTVTGAVSDGSSTIKDATVKLVKDSTVVSAEINEDGSFEIKSNLDSFDVVIEKPGCLTYTIKNVEADGDVELPEILLVNGDVNGDGAVNSDDLNYVWSTDNYLKSTDEEGVSSFADVNGDGKVNSDDLNIIWRTENYLKVDGDCIITY